MSEMSWQAQVIAGIITVFLLFILPKIHNRRQIEIVRKNILAKGLDDYSYPGGSEIYDTDRCLRIAKYAYGDLDDYRNIVRSALYVNKYMQFFIVEKGGLNQCRSINPYILTEKTEIDRWISRHLPQADEKTLMAIGRVLRECRKFASDIVGLHDYEVYGAGDFYIDVLMMFAEELNKEPQDWDKIKKIAAVANAWFALANEMMTKAERTEDLISKYGEELYRKSTKRFIEVAKKLGDKRMDRYCDMADALPYKKGMSVEEVEQGRKNFIKLNYGAGCPGKGFAISCFKDNMPVVIKTKTWAEIEEEYDSI